MQFTRALAAVTLAVAVVGCDATDYYPEHEAPLRSGDLRKDGPGAYGGNNGSFPVGTPGTTGAQMTAPRPAGGSATEPAGVGFQVGNGHGQFPINSTYSGRATGASSPDRTTSTPIDGTTNMGTAGGH